MTIRVGGAKDVAQVLAIERDLATAPHWPVAAYEEAAAQARLLVAEENGELVGFAVAAFNGEGAELESLGVTEDAQRRGIGRALVQEVVSHAGGMPMMLEVRAGSLGARRLYERAGFIQVGLRRRYYAAPEEDAVVMRRDSTRTSPVGEG